MTLPGRDGSSLPVSRLLLLAGQLALLTLLIRYFYIGGRPFVALSYLALGGFVVHALLPRRYRLGFFLVLSIAGIVLVAGPRDAAWLLLVVAGFVGVCLLPIGFRARVGALLLAGSAFAFLRVRGPVPWSEPLWPIIASILMFRLMVFVYDTHHERGRPPFTWTLSYFLMLPNVCFPLFPVVDFKRFRSTYYSEPDELIYRRGLGWMLRGIYQLLMYRIVYQFLTVAPAEVQSTPELLQYMLSSYGLYLRVSGLFHLIVGQLLLFGFNLPETHHRYFFASSFNDFWRRINIYWKDFMLKLFYYPAYFRLKRRGQTVALVGATAVVFLLTWLLHTYQWFWLRGTALFAVHDMLFWSVLGVAVVFNSLWEMRRGRERVLGEVRPFSNRWIARTGKVVATFTAICILWSMWSADSLSQWLSMWAAAGPSAAAIPAVIPAALLVSAWAAKRARAEPRVAGEARVRPPATITSPRWPRRHPLLEPAVAFGVLCVVVLAEHTDVAPGWPSVIERLRSDRLNARDARRQERGYYEHLINVNIGGGVGLIDAPPDPPDWITQNQAGLMRDRTDFLLEELRPDQDMIYKRARFQTNRWGMRDRDYPLAKPEGTVRIAVLGASHVMGTGVANGETFPDVLEQRLNGTAAGLRYEVLNFASGGLSPLDHLYMLETKVAEFEPDVVVYVMQEDVEHFSAVHLADVVQFGIEIPYGYLRDLVGRLDLNRNTSPEIILQKLTPHAAEIEAWAERNMAAAILAMDARPIAVYLPRTQRAAPDDQINGILRRAAEAGYHTIDLHAVYQGYDVDELSVAAWDRHPNPMAHGLVAERLLVELRRRPELLASPQIVADDAALSNLNPVPGEESNGSGR